MPPLTCNLRQVVNWHSHDGQGLHGEPCPVVLLRRTRMLMSMTVDNELCGCDKLTSPRYRSEQLGLSEFGVSVGATPACDT